MSALPPGQESDKKVCLITGAGGTLGTAFCRLFRDRYEIAAVHREAAPSAPDQHSRFVDPLRPDAALPENEHPVFAIRADLTGEGEIRRVVELTLARFGRIDVLVNAAVHSIWAPIVDSSALLDSIERQFELNAIVPLRLAAEIAAAFWRDRDHENRRVNRNVINVSSIAGIYIYPGQGQSAYSASKAALNNLTCHMASEFEAFGVRVNATAPDSFPVRVSTERAAESIVRLDEGSMSGEILILTENEERFL
jgi:NAD(P)-dependent dehydrogenase (short-subunit alcohol dehydrogenase family)